MNIQTIELKLIKPAEYNPRTITQDEFEGLKTSIKTFGQQENLIVNKDMTLISGHQRLNAMLALGWTEAVCNVVDLDKRAEKKLNVIMNSAAISGKYDDLKLSEILEELKLDDDYEALRLDKLEALDLSPSLESDQGKLDELNKLKCPECGYEDAKSRFEA
jgi:ParB-like chromosome segregation protein Spo0J